MEQTPRDKNRKNDAYMYGSAAPSPSQITYDGHASGRSSSNTVVMNDNQETSNDVPSNAGN